MHKSKEIAVFIICFLILSSLFIIYNNKTCNAAEKTIWVDVTYRYPEDSDGSIVKPFKYIQSAINAAEDGDTIKVLPGTYVGDIIIDKSITITTETALTTTITNSAPNDYLINIIASNVSLEKFTIKDTTTTSHRKAVIHIASYAENVVISGNFISHSSYGCGIYLDGTSSAVIKNNIVNDSRGINIENSNANSLYGNNVGNSTDYPALTLLSSNTNIIENNIFTNSKKGIYCHGSANNVIKSNQIFKNEDGILLNGGDHNTIENNTINNNNNFGISLSSSINYITKNIIFDNNININLESSNCVINDNSISQQGTYGIYAKSSSSGNSIFNNSFRLNYGMYHAKEEGHNNWYAGSIGNYWDDFYGPDPTSSSTLNTLKDEDFYYTEGGVCDKHPEGVFQKPPVISDPSPGPSPAEGVTLRPTLSVVVVDPESKRMDVSFYYIFNNNSYFIDSTNVESGKRASVPFYSTIQGQNAVYSYIGQGYDYIGIWCVVVKDQYSETKSQEWIFSTRNVPINNTKPVADAGGPYFGQINDAIQFDGSGSYDPDGTIVFYRWSFGDGTSITNVKSPVHIYKNPGKCNVSLVVIDNQGSSGTSSTTFESINNRPPNAKISGLRLINGNVGDSMQFSGSESSDLDSGDRIVNYSWDFGDGTNGAGQYANHTYSKSGTYAIKLTATDSKGATGSDTINVEITAVKSKKTPGYELVFSIIAILFVLIWRRRR